MTLFNQHQQLCFTQATCLTNQQPAQQDSVSHVGTITCHASSRCLRSFFLTWISQVPASVTDGCASNQGESKLYSECFWWISFSDSYSGLAGVDCSVVCPLMEPICLWGWCSKLSKVLSVMRVDFCKHEHSFQSCILNHFNTCDLAVRRLFKVLFQNDGFHIWMSRRNQ